MSGDFRKYGAALEELYEKLNRREYVSPDPLQFLYDYPDLQDREIVGIVAAMLAFGNVKSIIGSVADVLARIGRPHEFLMNSNAGEIAASLDGFYHRWARANDMAVLLRGVKGITQKYGSVNGCFVRGMESGGETVMDALDAFIGDLWKKGNPTGVSAVQSGKTGRTSNSLMPQGGASKRWHLFLRWMVRCDAVDPGGWTGISPAKLVIPLDTHMLRIAKQLGLTARSTANRACALEVTYAFRSILPGDPVKYDFALTRLGIRDDCDMDAFFRNCGVDAATSSAKRGG